MKVKATICNAEKAANETCETCRLSGLDVQQFLKKQNRNRYISLCAGLFLICEVVAFIILARSGCDLPWLYTGPGLFGVFFIAVVAIAVAVTYHFEAEENNACVECCLAKHKNKR